MQSKGTGYKSITNNLKALSSKWKLKSTTPTVEGENTYYVWSTANVIGDTTAIAVYIEEDATTTKYSLRYAYHNTALFNSIQQGLKSSPNYQGRITTFTDHSKGTRTVMGHPSEALPMASRFDFISTEYYIDDQANTSRFYSVDLSSRYIQK
jgi:hypothetical protein